MVNATFMALKKKYNIVKEQIKKYQKREHDLVQEIDDLRQQAIDKDTRYNATLFYLHNRILMLEDIIAQKGAGLPNLSQLEHIPDTDRRKDPSINSQLVEDESDLDEKLLARTSQTRRGSKLEHSHRVLSIKVNHKISHPSPFGAIQPVALSDEESKDSMFSLYRYLCRDEKDELKRRRETPEPRADSSGKTSLRQNELDDGQRSHLPTRELPQPLQKQPTDTRSKSFGCVTAEDIYEMFSTSDDEWSSNDDYTFDLISISDFEDMESRGNTTIEVEQTETPK